MGPNICHSYTRNSFLLTITWDRTSVKLHTEQLFIDSHMGPNICKNYTRNSCLLKITWDRTWATATHGTVIYWQSHWTEHQQQLLYLTSTGRQYIPEFGIYLTSTGRQYITEFGIFLTSIGRQYIPELGIFVTSIGRQCISEFGIFLTSKWTINNCSGCNCYWCSVPCDCQ
jgi:hypothetical protein